MLKDFQLVFSQQPPRAINFHFLVLVNSCFKWLRCSGIRSIVAKIKFNKKEKPQARAMPSLPPKINITGAIIKQKTTVIFAHIMH